MSLRQKYLTLSCVGGRLSCWCHLIVLVCLAHISAVHSLPKTLRIDPVREGVSSSKLDPTGGPVKIDLRKGFNFNNKALYTVWVHSDGFISLASPTPSMKGYPLNKTVRSFGELRHKLISVYMARANLSASGSVRYRVVYPNDEKNDCRMRNVLTRLEREVRILFPEDKSFRIEELVVVNWDMLVPVKGGRDKTNTFEAALLTNGEDSFVVFNYINIEWDRPPVQDGQLGDPFPQTGVADQESVYSLPLSGKPSAFILNATTNVATPGMWVLKTGRLRTDGEFKSPNVKYALDRSQIEEKLKEIRKSLGFGKDGSDPCKPATPTRKPVPATSALKAPLARRPQSCADLRCSADCQTYRDGSCCSCLNGYMGDGTICLEIESARIYVDGAIRFTVGSKRTTGQLMLQATSSRDANRGYVRFEGTKETASIAQILVPLFVTPIWYAARPENDGFNAVQLSGMRLKRRTNVDIRGFGQFAIEQTTKGLDSNGRGYWETNVTGSINERVDLPGPLDTVTITHMTMKVFRPGIIETTWTAEVATAVKTYKVKWTEEITYIPSCPFKPMPKMFTLYTKGLYATRIRPDSVYYISGATVRAGRPDTNPCAYPKAKCPGEKEQCFVTSPTTHDCRCQAGYEMRGRKCTDINECFTDRNRCDSNAICVNQPGTYTCQCKPGYRGDGFRCDRIDAICDRCSADATCVQKRPEEYACQCKPGYEGDGFRCTKKEDNGGCPQRCHYFATCVNGQCRCKEGLTGDGVQCFECSVSKGPRCHANAACYFDSSVNYYRCKCRKDFRGDGITSCVSKDFDCGKCDRNADCVGGTYCRCRSGYRDISGNGFACAKACEQTCHQHATCDSDGQCRCKPDYVGNGLECFYNCELCDVNADCDRSSGCRCRANFRGDGRVCIIDHECNRDSDCGENGLCRGVPLSGLRGGIRRQCSCKQGHVRENGDCVRLGIKLSIIPKDPIKVKEGDQVTFKCQIVEGSLLVGSLLWSKDKTPTLRPGIRISVKPDRRMKELIIIAARPEDSGRYYCRGGRVVIENFLRVEPNPCNRKCHRSGFCDVSRGQCACYAGFRGDGINSCIREVCSNFPTLCDKNSVCKNDVCVCNQGYKKVGDKCEELPDCRKTKDCDKNADCVNREGMYKCRCRNGYTGDGQKCMKKKLGCNLLNKCVENAECVYIKLFSKYTCRCKEGYFGSGELQCRKRYDCDKNPSPCGPNSRCRKERRYDDRSQTTITVGICECLPGHNKIEERCFKNENLNTSIFLSQGSIIYRAPVVQTPKRKTTIWFSNTDPEGYSSIVIALATDCNQRKVYWTSRGRGPSIYSALADKPSGRKIVAKNTGQIEGLAVDWIAGNIFFTVPASKGATIGVVTRDGSQRKVLVQTGVKRPRAIAVDPMNGKMYWTDWDRENPRIESANMDGSERQIVVEKLSNLPNGLVYDFVQRRLCWLEADKQTGKINSTTIFCFRPGLEPAPTKVFHEKDGRPFALSYNSPTFYYTDWQKNRLQAVRGSTREQLSTNVRTSSSKLYGVTVLPPKCPLGTNACSRTDNKYGGCKYLCLPVPNGGRVCACPENLKGCNPTV